MAVNISKLLSVAIEANHAVCENTAAMFVGKIKDLFKFLTIWKETESSSSVTAFLLNCL